MANYDTCQSKWSWSSQATPSSLGRQRLAKNRSAHPATTTTPTHTHTHILLLQKCSPVSPVFSRHGLMETDHIQESSHDFFLDPQNNGKDYFNKKLSFLCAFKTVETVYINRIILCSQDNGIVYINKAIMISPKFSRPGNYIQQTYHECVQKHHSGGSNPATDYVIKSWHIPRWLYFIAEISPDKIIHLHQVGPFFIHFLQQTSLLATRWNTHLGFALNTLSSGTVWVFSSWLVVFILHV